MMKLFSGKKGRGRNMDDWKNWNRRPTGLKIPARWLDRFRFNWYFGFQLHRVWFGDHRSEHSGIHAFLHFGPWAFGGTIICWENPYRRPGPRYKTLAEQIRETHGTQNIPDTDKIDEEEKARLRLLNKIVNEKIRQDRAREATEHLPPPGDNSNT